MKNREREREREGGWGWVVSVAEWSELAFVVREVSGSILDQDEDKKIKTVLS